MHLLKLWGLLLLSLSSILFSCEKEYVHEEFELRLPRVKSRTEYYTDSQGNMHKKKCIYQYDNTGQLESIAINNGDTSTDIYTLSYINKGIWGTETRMQSKRFSIWHENKNNKIFRILTFDEEKKGSSHIPLLVHTYFYEDNQKYAPTVQIDFPDAETGDSTRFLTGFYEYDLHGNVIKASANLAHNVDGHNSDEMSALTYDNSPNPFYRLPSITSVFDAAYYIPSSPNNLLSRYYEGELESVNVNNTYTYDERGYPITQRQESISSLNQELIEVREFVIEYE